jgi:TolB-like protein/AraC-like DNA-binding protein
MLTNTNKSHILKSPNQKEIDLLKGATEVVESNLSEEHFGVKELGRALGVSRSQLHRRLHRLIGISASAFIRQIRLNHANLLLEAGGITASEAAYRVGFGSSSYFTKCFHDYYGYPPGEIKKKNNKNKGHTFFSDESFIKTLINTPKEFRWSKDFLRKYARIKRRSTSIYVSAAILISIIVITILIFFISLNDRQLLNQDKSIAIIPFRNDSNEKDAGYFANGLSEEIIIHLSKIPGLKIPGRTSVEQFRETTLSIPEVAEKLNVSFILEGSVQKYGDKIKINVQLLDALRDEHLWSDSYVYEYESQLELIGEIALKISEKIRGTIQPNEKKDLRLSAQQTAMNDMVYSY